MANTGLRGPFPLNKRSIDGNVASTSAGAYALGRVEDGTFYVSYVGRSDSDIGDRLHDHVGSYSSFKFEYFATAKAAFEKECRLYHDFDPPANKAHPARPSNTNWKCPVCSIFG